MTGVNGVGGNNNTNGILNQQNQQVELSFWGKIGQFFKNIGNSFENFFKKSECNVKNTPLSARSATSASELLRSGDNHLVNNTSNADKEMRAQEMKKQEQLINNYASSKKEDIKNLFADMLSYMKAEGNMVQNDMGIYCCANEKVFKELATKVKNFIDECSNDAKGIDLKDSFEGVYNQRLIFTDVMLTFATDTTVDGVEKEGKIGDLNAGEGRKKLGIKKEYKDYEFVLTSIVRMVGDSETDGYKAKCENMKMLCVKYLPHKLTDENINNLSSMEKGDRISAYLNLRREEIENFFSDLLDNIEDMKKENNMVKQDNGQYLFTNGKFFDKLLEKAENFLNEFSEDLKKINLESERSRFANEMMAFSQSTTVNRATNECDVDDMKEGESRKNMGYQEKYQGCELVFESIFNVAGLKGNGDYLGNYSQRKEICVA